MRGTTRNMKKDRTHFSWLWPNTDKIVNRYLDTIDRRGVVVVTGNCVQEDLAITEYLTSNYFALQSPCSPGHPSSDRYGQPQIPYKSSATSPSHQS